MYWLDLTFRMAAEESYHDPSPLGLRDLFLTVLFTVFQLSLQLIIE